jgi:hypothetical protein
LFNCTPAYSLVSSQIFSNKGSTYSKKQRVQMVVLLQILTISHHKFHCFQ